MIDYTRFDEAELLARLPMALAAASKYKAKNPVCDEFDLEEAAIDALAEAICNRDSSKNFDSYVGFLITRRLHDVMRRTVGRKNQPSYRKRRGYSVAAIQMPVDESVNFREMICGAGSEPDPLCVSEDDEFESIEKRISKRDCDILRLRLQGYTYREIGKFYGKSEPWAHQRVVAMRETFKRVGVGS